MPQANSYTRPFEEESSIDCAVLEAIDFSGKEPQLIEYDYPELGATCPFSGLPDCGRVTVTMVPGKVIPELKSLKMYFVSYRNVGIYQEKLTDRVFTDLWGKFAPKYLRVRTVYNTRGGLDTTSVVERGDREAALERPGRGPAQSGYVQDEARMPHR